MTKFRRAFHSSSLARQLDAAPILRALLAQWQLPGPDAAPTRHGLRLAVRAGYLNFYAKGQSVAKVSLPRGDVRLEVHHKYLGAPNAGKDYIAYSGDTLNALPGAALDAWVGQALTCSSEEKRFVDDLVTANPGTIDLEMGLPGDPRAMRDGRKTAPRMDLVLLQSDGDAIRIAFWEAKCGDNGEIRATLNGPLPHVCAQLAQYSRWLHLPGRGAEVIAAYSETARILLDLAEIADKAPCQASDLWRRAAGTPLTMATRPGVVIGNYCAYHADRRNGASRSEMLVRRHATFHANGHHTRLMGEGIEVAEYAAVPDAPLPILGGRPIAHERAA